MTATISKYSILMPAVIAFIATVAASPFVIPVLHKFKFGQNVREDGPESHKVKQGTPTMGGVIILAAMFIASLFFIKGHAKTVLPVLLTTLAYGAVGFADDYLKIAKHNSDGLKAWQKMAGQFVIMVAFGIYVWKFSDVGTKIMIPFSGKVVDTGILFFPLMFFVMLGTTNGSNFTDGLDGLATSVTAVITAFFWILGLICGGETCIATSAMMGALLGFLCFNVHPAKIFMGDTGSLALGGFVASTAYMLGQPLILLIVAFIYLAEVLSVIIQVSYFKMTGGKRIFKMAPIHHHFELSGWEETKVVTMFTLATAILAIIALLAIL